MFTPATDNSQKADVCFNLVAATIMIDSMENKTHDI